MHTGNLFQMHNIQSVTLQIFTTATIRSRAQRLLKQPLQPAADHSQFEDEAVEGTTLKFILILLFCSPFQSINRSLPTLW